jgi:hypothetical protein
MIGRPIVDGDQLPWLACMLLERSHTVPRELKLVPALCGEVRYVAFSH